MTTRESALLAAWGENRDAEAFRELARKHAGMVFATCRRILENTADAEEVAQECFELLASHRSGGIRHVGGWLHRVATTRSLNRLRGDQARRARERRYAEESAGHTESGWDEAYRLLDEALLELPDRYRAPVVAHFFEGQTHEAIAQELGVSRQTITYRVSKGLARLRQSLSRKGVGITAAALAAGLAQEAAAVAPAAVHTAIGRIALAGASLPSATPLGARVLESATALKAGSTLWAAAAVLAIAGGAWMLFASDYVSTPSTMTHDESSASEATASDTIAAAPASIAGETPAARIEGRVVDEATGGAVAGVRVEARSAAGVYAATTDSNGRFQFPDARAGAYRIHVPELERFGLANADTADAVTVESGETIQTVATVRAYARPDAGRTSIRGSVTDADGAPVAGALVAIAHGPEGVHGSRSVTLTRPDGSFTYFLPQIVGDAYISSVWLQALKANRESRIHGPQGIAAEGLTGYMLVLDRELTASVDGVAVDPAGRPLNDVLVSLRSGRQPDLFGRLRMPVDEQGRFSFDAVAPDEYVAHVRVPGPGGMSQDLLALRFELKDGEAKSGVRLHAGAGDLLLWTGPAPEKTGLSVDGIVLDPDGEPMPKLQIYLQQSPGNGQIRAAATDDQGVFRFDDLEPGVAGLYVTSRHGELRFETEAGTGGLVLAFEREARYTLTCRVVDAATGRPITRFGYRSSPYYWRHFPGDVFNGLKWTSDDAGHFTIEGGAERPLSITVYARGYTPMIQGFHADEWPYLRECVFELEPGQTLRGRVIDHEDQPVGGASIFLGSRLSGIQSGEKPATLSQADGAFSIEDFPFGSEYLSANHADYAPALGRPAQDMVLQLQPPASLRVVLLEEGAPVRNAQISVAYPSEEGGGYLHGTTDANGVAVIDRMLAGRVSIQSDLPPSRTVFTEVELKTGETETITLDVPIASAAVDGVLPRDFQGGSFTLYLTTQAGRERYRGVVNPSTPHQFSFPRVAPGHGVFHFLAMSEGERGRVYTADVSAVAGQSTIITVPNPGFGRVEGMCYGLADDERVIVFALDGVHTLEECMEIQRYGSSRPETISTAFSEDNGAYAFPALPEGTFTLYAHRYPYALAQDGRISAVVHVEPDAATVLDLDFR